MSVTITELIWNAGNIAHISRHNVIREEVEEVVANAHHFSSTYDGRLRVIGRTKAGRALTVILAPRTETSYYIVTARPPAKKERHYLKGGEQAA
jgi:uncharacterized DUF497 family protein